MNEHKIALAGELALGVLSGEERRNAMRDVRRDPELRAEVRAWNEYFANMYDVEKVPDVAPGAHVFDRLETVLFGAPQRGTWDLFLDFVRAPENRSLVLTVAAAKIGLVAWLVYLFL